MTDDQSASGTLKFGHDHDLNEIVAKLNVDDKVLVDDRSIPLEVIDRTSEKIGSNPHETRTVYLEGRNGRVYRLRGEYGHNAGLKFPDTTPPMIELRKENEWDTKSSSVSSIKLADGQEILSDTHAGEWLSEAGIDVR